MQPHSKEWFDALEKVNPQQAEHTRKIITRAGSDLVCGSCGDTPAGDYDIENAPIPMRWCEDCRAMKEAMGVRSKLRIL